MVEPVRSAHDEIIALMAEAAQRERGDGSLRGLLQTAGETMMRSDAVLRQLMALRIPREFLLDLHAHGWIGVGQVSIGHEGGTWEPEGPDRRLLLAVCERGEPVDVLALASGCEDEWSLLTGLCPMLGWDTWQRAQLGLVDRVRVWATPIAWLRSGGTGICVLRWDAEALGMLRGLGEGVRLVVEPEAKERLRALLAYGGLPRIEAARAPMQGKMAA